MKIVIDSLRKDFINEKFLYLIGKHHVFFSPTFDDIAVSLVTIWEKLVHMVDKKGFASDFPHQFDEFGVLFRVLLTGMWAASILEMMFKVICFLLIDHVDYFVLAYKLLLEEVDEMGLLLGCKLHSCIEIIKIVL